MPFLYSIEEHKKDKHKYAMITGFDEKASDLVVPAEIDGYTVEAIGNHAFSGRQDLISVSLPKTVKTLYGFAFHNCRKLKKIALFDSIDDYYDGVCRQCDSLKEVEITMIRGWYEVVRNFLADNDRTLRFILNLQTDPGTAAERPVRSVLTFPEYVYDFNENTMARTIQFSIAGSGMFYRECVDRRSIDYRQYDRLFEKAVIDGGEISENIAIDRLLYPVELSDDFRKTYEDHVRANAESILRRLVEQYPDEPENLGTVKALLTYNNDDPDKEVLPGRAIDEAIKLSADKGFAQMSAVLMEAGRALAEDQMFKL